MPILAACVALTVASSHYIPFRLSLNSLDLASKAVNGALKKSEELRNYLRLICLKSG